MADKIFDWSHEAAKLLEHPPFLDIGCKKEQEQRLTNLAA